MQLPFTPDRQSHHVVRTRSGSLDRLYQKAKMMSKPEERLVERRVTYTLELDGKFFLVRNVPARVNEETGEQFFAPSTVERLQETILSNEKPAQVIETPVYEYHERPA